MPDTEEQKQEKRKRKPAYKKQVDRIKDQRVRDSRQTALKAVAGLLGLGVVGAIGWAGIVQLQNYRPVANTQTNINTEFPTVDTPTTNWLARTQLDSKTLDALNGALSVITPVCFMGGLGLFIYARSTRRKYLEFDKVGMLITDSRRRGEGNARFIPWGCLEAVEVIEPNAQAKHPLQTSHAEKGNLIKPTRTYGEHVVAFYVDDGSSVKVLWRDIMSCTEPGAFINALKTWAPAASDGCAFPGGIQQVDEGTYTQLWFKYYSTASDRKRTGQLPQGDTLSDGRFQVVGAIGGGGQGTAYLALDAHAASEQHQEIVLKEYILPVHRGQQVLEATIKKLEQEAAILRIIDHPNIVKMMAEFVEDHRGYLVMEYVQGRSLKELVHQEGPQPENAVKEFALQICSVLDYLHHMTPAVVHRDLTPDNLILQDDGIVKLVDFNVAHQLESAATATVVGKHCYIPPEQFRGRPTAQSDIYAFGCTMHYLLTGQEPEPLTVSRPRTLNENVSEELNAIVATCTQLDAVKRFNNIEEVRQALEALGSDSNKDGHKITLPKKDYISA